MDRTDYVPRDVKPSGGPWGTPLRSSPRWATPELHSGVRPGNLMRSPGWSNLSAEVSMFQKVASSFLGHPKGFWFFFWGEFAERCSYYGMRAILTLYMAEQLGLGQQDAGTYM